jgi:hypothetical protein
MSYTGAKGSHLANKKTKKWVQKGEQGITEGSPGLAHRTVSGAPGDFKPNFAPSGILRDATLKFTGLFGVPPNSVRCSRGERL